MRKIIFQCDSETTEDQINNPPKAKFILNTQIRIFVLSPPATIRKLPIIMEKV